jgi:nitroreductase
MTWDLDRAGFVAVVADAGRAPSVHNTQPWRFRLTGPTIEVHLDPDRTLPATDPTGRNARVSCGAAVCGLALSLAVRGTPATVSLPVAGTLLAELRPAAARPPTPTESQLYRAIAVRHSNRQPFLDTAVPTSARVALSDAARAAGGWLDLVADPPTLADVGELIRTADRSLADDAVYRAELRSWLRTDPRATDGVHLDSGGPARHATELLVRRDFGNAGRPRPFEPEPILGALGVHGERAPDDVRAGMVLQQVLLTATHLGLATSIFTQPVDVPQTRAQLAGVRGRAACPHVLLRIGYAAPLFPTPRRVADDTIG